MSLPIVAVVGRPNVGKSSFFNRVIGGKISIVEDVPGVTRDRIYAEAEWTGKKFALVDTGGIDEKNDDYIAARMREQALIAMDMADLILFMVDGKEGMTAADAEVAVILRQTRKPVVLIVNKVDGRSADAVYEFYELGFGDPVPVSSANMTGLGDALDIIVAGLGASDEEREDDAAIRLAIIGKPNAGKSSFVNAIVGEDRVIVSDVAGTTRDSVDTPFEYDGEKYVLVDTAGIRRRSKVTEAVERYSVIRAIGAIERSDVSVLMIDATDGVTEQDKKIAGIVREAGKGIVIAVNKWDLIEKDGKTMDKFREEVRTELSFLSYAPDIFISVKEGQRLRKVLSVVHTVYQNCQLRIPTAPLNSLIQDAMAMKPPPSDKGKRLKIYYVTQVGVKPPVFAFKINQRSLMHFSYARYLENKIRKIYGFEGTPVSFVFREKGENEA
ncbi:MAG: ribosome biogenesis GTPase Der [Clostridiales Family XIII bacterium]|jgi:GTP-binding protein|nr:ribosome biogenesis GTPase Der [Clostridiales Family XIII bacterium]